MTNDHHLHHRASLRDYLAGQLLTILVVGVFGLVGVLMYRNSQLGYILALPFHRPVLIGGITVLVLVALRAVSIWREARQFHNQAHAGLDCNDHQHTRHQVDEPEAEMDDHGHGHDLTWVFSRLLILCFPVGLFLVGVPNSGFSQDRIRMLLGGEDALSGNLTAVTHRNGTVASFDELMDAANDEGKRQALQGQTAILEGRIHWINTRQFSLFRLKMTCCAADTVPLKVRIVLKNGTLSKLFDFEWVQMKGHIQFVQAPNSERHIPVIVVEDSRDIRRTGAKGEYE